VGSKPPSLIGYFCKLLHDDIYFQEKEKDLGIKLQRMKVLTVYNR